MIALVIRDIDRHFNSIRVTKADTLDKALYALGVCDDETVELGTISDSMVLDLDTGKFVINVGMYQFTNTKGGD